MNKKHLLELLLFLTEIRTKHKINSKDRWELDNHIKLIKELVDTTNDQNSLDKNKSKSVISDIIKWIIRFLTSP
jgi:hypothetical protein